MPAPTTQANDPVLTIVLGLLTPLLANAGVEGALALSAIQQTIAAYNPAGSDQLLTVAQIVGFALTSLDSLRLSMPEALSVSMKLRLRGNANALTQSSQRAAAALDTQRHHPATAPQEAPRQPAPAPPDRQRELSWAEAMTTVAAEFAAELAQLTPDERKRHLRRIDALTKTASDLKCGNIRRH